jgi:hypothetical protein
MFNMDTDVTKKIAVYSRAAFESDVTSLQDAWRTLQRCRSRDGVYAFLTEVFDLVCWWLADEAVKARAIKKFAAQGIHPSADIEPFAAAIMAAAEPAEIDRRTVSKWARVLRLAHQFKPGGESLAEFARRAGGLNGCASQYARRLGRLSTRGRGSQPPPLGRGRKWRARTTVASHWRGRGRRRITAVRS